MTSAVKWLTAILKTLWFIFFISWAVVGWIETSSFDQPTDRQYPYEFPHEVKGKIRYFTELQDRIYRVGKPAMLGAFCIGFPMLILTDLLEQRAKNRAIRQALERDDPE
jgi:hypothetical protein